MIEFASEYGKWLRAHYPVYLLCTGLYENIEQLYNVKNLTFFRRATTIKTQPLNSVRMAELYRQKLNVDIEVAKRMSFVTKGYAYAFQELGVLSFKKKDTELLNDTLDELKSELYAYSYEKIWEELTPEDRSLVRIVADKDEYKREEVLQRMDKPNNYSVYRERLVKRGVISARQGYIALALPFFGDYIKDYHSSEVDYV